VSKRSAELFDVLSKKNASRTMKKINIILTLLFILFAFWQINDSDSWLWLVIYGVTAAMYGAAIFSRFNKYLIYIGIIGSLVGLGILFPELLNWIELGTPNIAESMKTERPYIEFAREFFGLVINLAAMLFLLFQISRST